jgi:uncharacterized membrane protein YdbT with pleckstrin-like domain
MTAQTPTQPQQTLTYLCPHCRTPEAVDAKADDALLTCPACRKPFRVEIPKAQPASLAPPCPPASSTSPATAVAGAQAAAAAAAAAASSPQTPETPPETIHLAMFRRYPFRCLGYVLLSAAGLVGLIYGVDWNWHWLTILGAVVALFAAVRFFLWGLRMSRTTLTLTNKRGTLSSGLFRREDIEFELARLKDLHVHQTLPMRWLDVGDLAIVTSTGQRVVVMAIPNPAAVAEHMQRHGEREKKAQEQPDPVVVQQPIIAGGAPARTA